MDSKLFLAATVVLCTFGVSDAFMCYNCTQGLNDDCGEVLVNPENIPQVSCSGICATIQQTASIIGQEIVLYTRTCLDEVECTDGCSDLSEASISIADVTACYKCCTTDLCNDAYTEQVMTTPNPNNACSNAVNILTTLFTLFIFKTMV
ncbi:uncharacterized protein [Antedon mediterranea]|uniref:uncharacterized protein n=1 Tax=Antedon mediterranea TaxID=105859 RepID=UPI003AF87BD4